MLTGKLLVDRDRRYSIKETCSILGISPKTLRKYTKSGDIQVEAHAPMRQLFYRGSSIEKFYNQTI